MIFLVVPFNIFPCSSPELNTSEDWGWGERPTNESNLLVVMKAMAGKGVRLAVVKAGSGKRGPASQ